MSSKVIAVFNGKGGVGKTLLSTNVAAMAARIGLLVTILDYDQQPSSFYWYADRKENKVEPLPTVTKAPSFDALARFVSQARKQEADLILIDCPPRLDENAAKIVQLADEVMIPLKPEPMFVKALPQTMKLVQASGKPYFVVLTDVPTTGPEGDETVDSLQAARHPVSPFVLHSRKPFWNRANQGITAADYDPSGKAAAELLGLVLWIAENVGLLESIQKYKSILEAADKTTRILRQLRELDNDEDSDETPADHLRTHA